MRKNRLWIFLLLLLAGGGGSLCAQSMSDSQVLLPAGALLRNRPSG